MQHIPRRTILKGVSGLVALAVASPVLRGRPAHGATSLVVVEGGGPWLEAAKQLASAQDKVEVIWEVTGSGAAIMAKVKATWPNVQYDVLPAWDATYHSMMREGWLEPVTVEEIPNLQDIPGELFFHDESENIINVPRSLAGFYWGYRKDTVPFEITKLEDLLDPRLKGQICWPEPAMNTNTQTVSLALHGGGDEFNMDSGWEFLKELASGGNIGRVAKSDVDFINSLTSGETSVSFWNQGGWNAVAKDFPCTFLTKVLDDPGMKTFVYQEGWVILRSSKNKAAAKELLNFCISAENNQAYNEVLGQAPVNQHSKPPAGMQHMMFTKAEFGQHVYVPDWGHLSASLDGWSKQWERDIAPLL